MVGGRKYLLNEFIIWVPIKSRSRGERAESGIGWYDPAIHDVILYNTRQYVMYIGMLSVLRKRGSVLHGELRRTW